MPADGSQYLVTEQRSATTRGDTSATTHSQTVLYQGVTDAVTRNLSNNKETEVVQAAFEQETTYNAQTDRATTVLIANKVSQSIQSASDQDTTYNNQTDRATTVLAASKVQVSDQAQLTDGTGSTTVKGPRSIQVQFTVDLLGTTIFC